MNSKVMLLLLAIVGAAISHPLQDALGDSNWKAWKSFHGKAYKDLKEERIRNFVWQDNLKKIVRHNEEGHSYTLAMNNFGDMVNKGFYCQFSKISV